MIYLELDRVVGAQYCFNENGNIEEYPILAPETDEIDVAESDSDGRQLTKVLNRYIQPSLILS